MTAKSQDDLYSRIATLEATIATLSEALAEAEKKGAEVKALEWTTPTDHPQEDDEALWTAMGLGGRYSISEEQSLHMGGRGHLLWWAHDGFRFTEFRTVEEAKAAAQADFSARVLGCLAPPRDLSQGGQP